MTRTIKISEAKYREGVRAKKRLEDIKPDIEELHKRIWKVKRKFNKGRQK